MLRRRFLLTGFLGLLAGTLVYWLRKLPFTEKAVTTLIKNEFPLDFQWATKEPFLFCVHHDDHYPKGNGQYGPAPELLKGRDIGQDFTPKDGFRMYHGQKVPGFPVHPHRGFETITIVRKGYVDHADSIGAAGRYGQGDVQWMTAGRGIQHSEMFPLLKTDADNRLELFQIWLNLPRKSKMVEPHFKMLWSEQIPKVTLPNNSGEVTVIAGNFGDKKALSPPPDSWASNTESEISILLIKLNKTGIVELPATQQAVTRMAYFFAGDKLSFNGQEVDPKTGFALDSQATLKIESGSEGAELLILQAKPIGEPVAQHGPFVMNTREEIIQTVQDYQRTQFGGWSWQRDDMVHGDKIDRFAKYPDGRIEKPV